jgi:diaminohydroxyphosphoribosylaminopyrimidine deaminase/5-amino-6-(5-phosphoribosylamino)uracil reductase
MTLDGKIATAKGESRWISSEESRREAHALRHEHDAVLVGVGTILADDPELTARGEDWYRQPLRIVVDSRLRTPPDARVAAPNTLVATLAGDPQVRRQLESNGVEVLEIAPTSDGRVDIQDLLRLLGERPLLSVLVEGGPQVHGALFDARVVDAAAIFIAPLLVGGENAPSAVAGHGITALGDAYRLEEVTLRKLGPDIMITGDVQWDR